MLCSRGGLTKVPVAQMSASASGPELSCLRVELASFGFSHKAPEGIDTDSIFDLRALPNPKSYAAESLNPGLADPLTSRQVCYSHV